MSKPEFVYVIYIASTPEQVFKALTDENMSEQYWVGNRVVSDWKIGAPFALKLQREAKDVTGKVLEFDPPPAACLLVSCGTRWHGSRTAIARYVRT